MRDKKSRRLVEMQVDVIASTEKAYLLSDGEREKWFPRAYVDLDNSRPKLGVVAMMPEWLALEKEFI